MNRMPLLLSEREMRKELGVGRTISEKIIAALPVVQLGPKCRRWRLSDVEKYLAENTLQPGQHFEENTACR